MQPNVQIVFVQISIKWRPMGWPALCVCMMMMMILLSHSARLITCIGTGHFFVAASKLRRVEDDHGDASSAVLISRQLGFFLAAGHLLAATSSRLSLDFFIPL